MLADPKAEALVENFAGQWLYLRELEHVQTEAKNFDDNLRQSFRRETEMLFGRSSARIAASSICSTPTTRSWTSGWRATTASRTSRGSYFRRVPLAAGQPAPRPARPGQHADGDVDRRRARRR